MNLDAAIAAFSALHPEWSTTEGAFMACEDAAHAFLRFLADEDVWLDMQANREMFLRDGEVPSEMATLYAAAPEACNIHWVVVANGLVIDWTARQYDATAAFPLVYER